MVNESKNACFWNRTDAQNKTFMRLLVKMLDAEEVFLNTLETHHLPHLQYGHTSRFVSKLFHKQTGDVMKTTNIHCAVYGSYVSYQHTRSQPGPPAAAWS